MPIDEYLDKIEVEMVQGLRDHWRGLKGLAHPSQLVINLLYMMRHPIEVGWQAALFTWNHKLRTATNVTLSFLEGRLIGYFLSNISLATEGVSISTGNSTVLTEAGQIASTLGSHIQGVCSSTLCTLPGSPSAVTFFPTPVMHTEAITRPNALQQSRSLGPKQVKGHPL